MSLESIAATLLILIALMMIGLYYRAFRQAHALHCVKEQLDGLLVHNKGLSKQVQQYQKALHNIHRRQDCLETKESDGLAYKHMDLLLNKGLTEDEMVSICELSRSEIRMIADLKKAKRDTDNAKPGQTRYFSRPLDNTQKYR